MIRRLIPHVCIIFSLVTITFLVLGQFNPIMGKSFVHIAIFILSVAAIIASAFLIAYNRKR